MVSLKDIARKCGVSTATVSKALNGQPDIGEETRKRVTDMANELGYLANSAARALKTNRTYNLGVLFTDLGDRGLTHEFFAAVLNSFKSEAESKGYDITFISNCNIDSRSASYLQHCRYRGVDGLLIANIDYSGSQIRELAASELPLVTLDHRLDGRPAVLSDNGDGTAALVRYAYAKGHRRIAFIHGEASVDVTQERLQGFRKAAGELGLSIPDCCIVPSRYYQPDSCREAMNRLLQQAVRPTCVLLPDDFALAGAISAIREAKLRIPEDISVMGYDGTVLSEVMDPKITTYHQNTEMLGAKAAELLIAVIEHPDTAGCDALKIHGHLTEGASVADLTLCD